MNRKFTMKIISVLVMCALLLPSFLIAPVMAAGIYPLQSTDQQVADALDYLRLQQDTEGCVSDFATSAWVTMAIDAAGEDPHSWSVGGSPSIVDYLETNAGSAASTSDYSRMILAIAAADEDPTSFGGIDFVSLLEAAYDGTQIGDATLLNDDFWGVMALIAAGSSPASTIIADSVSFILANQNGDGGWSWGVGQASDVDDAVAAVMALIAAGESQSSAAVTSALAYIKTTQMDNGGFESWGSTNSATDSWGIDSIVATGQDPTSAGWVSGSGFDPVDDLLDFQNEDGSFNWIPSTPSNKELMTAYAIPALLGVPYPVAKLTQSPAGVTVDVRVEGENDTIWSGTVTVSESTIIDDQGGVHNLEQPTALGALDEASQAGNFPYVVGNTAYGLYVSSINGEEPAGAIGWQYRVDYSSPMVGTAAFILGETTPPDPPHQEVLFSYSAWGQPPLKIEVDKTEPGVGEQFTATVSQYSDDTGTWSPCESATVHANQDYSTGPDGTVAITINSDMTLDVYAEKLDFIRSNRVTVTVGNGSGSGGDNGVGLSADIIPAISINVTPENIDFGTLGPRDTSDPHAINISNEGAWNVQITCTVEDNSDGLYTAGLELDGTLWSLFSSIINRDANADCSATLTVPEDYPFTGGQEGTIIFWAEEAP